MKMSCSPNIQKVQGLGGGNERRGWPDAPSKRMQCEDIFTIGIIWVL